VIELNGENFESEVIKADMPVLVDFWSESCVPCKELMPDVHNLSETYSGKMKFCKLNIQGNRRLAMSQQVMSLPSIVFYINGEKKEHLTGSDLDIALIEKTLKTFI